MNWFDYPPNLYVTLSSDTNYCLKKERECLIMNKYFVIKKNYKGTYVLRLFWNVENNQISTNIDLTEEQYNKLCEIENSFKEKENGK